MLNYIYRILLVVAAASITACGSQTSSDSEDSFTEIDFTSGFSWSDTKTHPAVGSLPECSGESCVAVYYNGAIAVRSSDGSVILKVFKPEGQENYRVFLKDGSSVYGCSDVAEEIIFSSAPTLSATGTDESYAEAVLNYADVCGSGVSIAGSFKGVVYE